MLRINKGVNMEDKARVFEVTPEQAERLEPLLKLLDSFEKSGWTVEDLKKILHIEEPE